MKLEKALTVENINQSLLNIEYAVRGPLVHRAEQIERELQKGAEKPFDRVVRANLGDCHALGQKPFTFIRQIMALAVNPELLDSPHIPGDVKERVRAILKDCRSGSIGAYSPAQGLNVVRQSVVQYLEARDGLPACIEDVYLGSGASDLIKAVLQLMAQDVDGKPPSVMIPIPQYPLFSGTLTELGIGQAHYYLDEDYGWALKIEELERSWREANEKSLVRALVVINPGNPTGQVLSKKNIEEIIKFAYERDLLIIADEVYQENIICKPFHSFKKVMYEMGETYSSVMLASFLTISKGWAAECGVRGAFVELLGFDEGVKKAFLAARALAQCPNLLGQCALNAVMIPPRPGEESYETWKQERTEVAQVLADRALLAYTTFNSIPGCTCNPIDGAMFAFPRIDIPARAIQEAAQHHLAADEFYCMNLLEDTGICIVPGSGFGQAPGSFHFRTTMLHPRQEFEYMLECIERFHRQFMDKYS